MYHPEILCVCQIVRRRTNLMIVNWCKYKILILVRAAESQFPDVRRARDILVFKIRIAKPILRRMCVHCRRWYAVVDSASHDDFSFMPSPDQLAGAFRYRV